MNKAHNQLTYGQAERLAVLAEELAEAGQRVAKVLRHGYCASNPNDPSKNNLFLLEEELGHVINAIDLLSQYGDVSRIMIDKHAINKRLSISKHLHHNI